MTNITIKNRGEYLPSGFTLDENHYYHGTKPIHKERILDCGLNEKMFQTNVIGYYGEGFYASRSKEYAKRYGKDIIVLKAKDDVDLVKINETPRNGAIDRLNADIVEINDGIEVIIKNIDVVKLIGDIDDLEE